MTGHAPAGPADSVPLSLRTLGTAGLFGDGRPEPLLGPGKPLALLVYLALAPGRRISRESLLDLLWADLEPERARGALRQVLFHLRRLLGDDALPGSEELTLARDIDSDRDRFLEAVERGELEVALEWYDGDFLPNFGVPGGARFEHWADVERHRLRSAFIRSTELLVRRRLNESRFRDAQRIARRVRDQAPGSEVAWRLLLESVIAGRDFVSAAVEAAALERWASAEEVNLEPATRATIARARRISPTPSDAHDQSSLVAELTGREREFSAITAAWEGARVGHARHLHLTAPAGFGKTRLLRDAVARLRAAGAAVVETRGTPGDREIPYAFAGDLAVAIAALPGAAGIAPASAEALIALNPALSSYLSGEPDLSQGDDALRRRVHAMADLVSAVADEQPFVLAMDDVHWADPLSYRVLEGLLGRLNGAHVLCLTTSRPDRRPSTEGAMLLPLAPLTEAQVTSLVSALGIVPVEAGWGRELLGGLPGATRGSPLLVLETLRLAMDQGILALDQGEWRCLDETRLKSLLRAGEALRQRVRALPEEHAWVLALLATAGAPLALEHLATAVGRPREVLAEVLVVLERQGLAMRDGGAWLPAHDEIAAAGREALGPERQAAAERAVGELLIRSAGTDAQHLLRGVRHLVAAGEDDAVRGHFRRYVRLARDRHDRRPFAQLAAELLGEDGTTPRAAALVRSLPPAWRLGLWSGARQGIAAAAALLVTVGGSTITRVRATREAMLPRLVYVDTSGATRAARIDAEDWDGRDAPVTLRRASTTVAAAALAFPERSPALSPDGRSVAWNQNSGDSTTIDIWLRTPAGTRRLTTQARDDLVHGWLVDGSALVGLTNRWSPPEAGNYDVAVFDTASGAARQVTRGPSHDGAPSVSPDGTRIAFIREFAEAPPHVCVVALDGIGEPECRLIAGFPVQELLGWSGAVELIATLDSAGARPLVRYDWQRNEHAVLIGPHVYRGRLSLDRRWVAGAVRLDGIRGFRDWIVPVDRPTQARQVGGIDAGAGSVRWWEGKPEASRAIDRIEFTDTARTILAGVGARLSVRALSAAGTELPVHAPVRWHTSDTLVAIVDSDGDVHPRSSGRVTIDASLAGWRTARRDFTVRAEPPKAVLDERWDAGWTARWIAFGDPAPLVTEGPGSVRAFWNHGDGTYPSMALLRQALPARDGLGMEIRVSSPVTRADWQRARTGLVAGVDTAAFAGADQRSSPPSIGRDDARCGAEYPGGAGRYGQGRLVVSGGVSVPVELGEAQQRLSSGAWWTLRLQIFPDGRCGVAVDGHAVWLSTEPVPLDVEYRVRLGDESAATKMLHGPLQVWTGVRTDIDWERLQKPF